MKKPELLEHHRCNAWASRRALEMAQQLPPGEASRDLTSSHGGVLGTLAHIYVADRMWWSRLHGKGRASLVDPGEEFSLESLARDWPRPDLGVEKHESYALQWYSFAALSVALLVALSFRRDRQG